MNNHHHQSKSHSAPDTTPRPVHFEFTHPTAHQVGIAGTFNDWHPEAKPMHFLGHGRWVKETELAPGTYEYCLVVDGMYYPDPLAKESVPNPFGGRNSVLHVAGALSPAHLAEQVTSPLNNQSIQQATQL